MMHSGTSHHTSVTERQAEQSGSSARREAKGEEGEKVELEEQDIQDIVPTWTLVVECNKSVSRSGDQRRWAMFRA